MFQWSDKQERIFAEALRDERHIIVESRAGTSKTTSAIEMVRRYNEKYPNRRVLISAFNKRIRDEIEEKKTRAGVKADVMGIHQIGFALCRGALPGVQFNDQKSMSIASAVCVKRGLVLGSGSVDYNWRRKIEKLASMAKLTLASIEDLPDLCESLELNDVKYPKQTIIDATLDALQLSLVESYHIDYDDQIWFPTRANMTPRLPYDLVIGDEVQDWNHCELWNVRRMVAATGKLALFGDPFQAVYEWKGAAKNAMELMGSFLETTVFGCARMSLTVTYRCPKKVVSEAQRIVPDLQAAPQAPEGIVRNTTINKAIDEVQPGDVIISRKKLDLARACLMLVKRGKPAHIVGRDYGDSLIALIERANTEDIDALETWLDVSKTKEVTKLLQEGKDIRAQDVSDNFDTLKELARSQPNVRALTAWIARMFRDKSSDYSIPCSTLHKAKGLEWQRVFLLAWTFSAKSDEELRISYVAITRAQNELVYVLDPVRDAMQEKKKADAAASGYEWRSGQTFQEYFDLT